MLATPITPTNNDDEQISMEEARLWGQEFVFDEDFGWNVEPRNLTNEFLAVINDWE